MDSSLGGGACLAGYPLPDQLGLTRAEPVQPDLFERHHAVEHFVLGGPDHAVPARADFRVDAIPVTDALSG